MRFARFAFLDSTNDEAVQSLGTLEGYSSAGGAAGFEDEDQLMELAMQNLIANARCTRFRAISLQEEADIDFLAGPWAPTGSSVSMSARTDKVESSREDTPSSSISFLPSPFSCLSLSPSLALQFFFSLYSSPSSPDSSSRT